MTRLYCIFTPSLEEHTDTNGTLKFAPTLVNIEGIRDEISIYNK